jgi:hypothetical protein
MLVVVVVATALDDKLAKVTHGSSLCAIDCLTFLAWMIFIFLSENSSHPN